MTRAQRTTRQFASSDSYMVGAAATVYHLMNASYAAFTNVDSTFDADFLNDYGDALSAAQAVISDNVVVDQVAEKTEIVKAVMASARTKYGEVKYFIVKAYPDSKATQNQFGLNDYLAVRRSAPKMVDFLRDLFAVCTERQSDLVTAGLTAPKILEIDTLHQSLIAANEAQDLAKAQRPKTTEDRIRILNNLYAMMTRVNAAAQIVFIDSAAQQMQFVFSPSRSGNGYDEPGDYSGTVAPNGKEMAVKMELEPADELELSNTTTGATNVVLSYYFTSTPTGEPTASALKQLDNGSNLNTTAGELGASASNIYLVVRNESGSAVGRWGVGVGDDW